MSDSDDFELDDTEIQPAVLTIRAHRDGSFEVVYEGLPLPVDHIDVDEDAIDKLKARQFKVAR